MCVRARVWQAASLKDENDQLAKELGRAKRVTDDLEEQMAAAPATPAKRSTPTKTKRTLPELSPGSRKQKFNRLLEQYQRNQSSSSKRRQPAGPSDEISPALLEVCKNVDVGTLAALVQRIDVLQVELEDQKFQNQTLQHQADDAQQHFRGLEKQLKLQSIAASAQRKKIAKQKQQAAELKDAHDEAVLKLADAQEEVAALKRKKHSLPSAPQDPTAGNSLAFQSSTGSLVSHYRAWAPVRPRAFVYLS